VIGPAGTTDWNTASLPRGHIRCYFEMELL